MNRGRMLIPGVCLAGAVLIAVFSLWGPATAQEQGKDKGKPATKWEYKVEFVAGGVAAKAGVTASQIETSLNAQAKDGWELVATVGEVLGGGANRTTAHLIFKRPKQ